MLVQGGDLVAVAVDRPCLPFLFFPAVFHIVSRGWSAAYPGGFLIAAGFDPGGLALVLVPVDGGSPVAGGGGGGA